MTDTAFLPRKVLAETRPTAYQRLQSLSGLRRILPQKISDIRQFCQELLQEEGMPGRDRC